MAWIDVKKAHDSVGHGWLSGVILLHRSPVWLCRVMAKLCRSWNTRVLVVLVVTRKVACVASVSVRLRSKERGTRVKDRAKNGVRERAGKGWGKKGRKVSFLPLPRPQLSFFGSCFISRVAKTENPVPRSFFAPKPNGNACYAGYKEREGNLRR